MIERYTQGKLTWIDLFNPTQDEIREMREETRIAPELCSDLTMPVPHPEARMAGKTLKIVIDFPVVRRTDMDHPHEVKFLVAKHTLVTARYEEMEAMHRFSKEFDVITTLFKTDAKADGGHLYFSIMTEMYVALASKLDYLESRLVDIEHGIFDGHEKEMVSSLSQVSRRLITFRQILKTHEDVFRQSKDLFRVLFKSIHDSDIEALYTSHTLLMRRTNGIFEMLAELRNTNIALLSTKQNEIMKILTIMAFITFPLSLFTSLFGMNTTTTPLIGQHGDFWIILGIMSVVTIFFFIFFKYKKWI